MEISMHEHYAFTKIYFALSDKRKYCIDIICTLYLKPRPDTRTKVKAAESTIIIPKTDELW